jgi:hypothetical protein
MPGKPREGAITGPKWLVRSATGDLFVISENNPPVKLTGETATVAKGILNSAEAQLSEKIPQNMSSLASGVSLAITEAFGHH